MCSTATGTIRHFTTYSGVRLPLKLVNEIPEGGLDNRNTFFRGAFDEQDRLLVLEKIVYAELELKHVYSYHPSGALRQAQITDADGETSVLVFDEAGNVLR
ncbi:DUF6156 family protein [Stutzerimonas tarimensis]|uniref:DUF6156 family protein n=1 Tax=Stutzerimonas tarimensis TaxID=1507735 RepID=A0ABV7TAR5_9GAMM